MVDRGEGGADEAVGAISELVDSDQVDVGPASDDRPFPTTQEIPLQHAVLPALVERETQSRSRNGPVLLALAAALAVTCGVLGALLLQERSEVSDLRSELEQATTANEAAVAGLGDVSELNDEVRTLTLQNEQLQAQLNDMSALVLELPEGRVTEIVVPFTPVFADEENGRFIAMSSEGEYVVWAEGADGVITDSGQVSGSPTGLFAAARKAWISTDADKIDIVSLTNEEGLPSVDFGPAVFLAPEERAYWTYDQSGGAVVRLRKGDGGITATVPVPVPVVDLTIGAGSVWALGENGRVYRINTADFTVQAIDAGVDLISITAGPDALWTLSAADGSLRRVDPVTGEVLVTVPVGRDPIDATFAGSSVWVALRSGTSLIEVDTRTAAVISRTRATRYADCASSGRLGCVRYVGRRCAAGSRCLLGPPDRRRRRRRRNLGRRQRRRLRMSGDPALPDGLDQSSAPSLWEQHAEWWQDEFTDGADPEYEEQILPLAAQLLAGYGPCARPWCRRRTDCTSGLARWGMRNGDRSHVVTDASGSRAWGRSQLRGGWGSRVTTSQQQL